MGPRLQRVVAAILLLLLIAIAAPTVAERPGSILCALPVVLRSALTDVHESFVNGPEGYTFFAEAGVEKTGTLPRAVGEQPTRRFETDVYASNFQGPLLVQHRDLRAQWEWTGDGEIQLSERAYPIPLALRCAAAGALPRVRLHVREHDEPPGRNDAVGAFTVDLPVCDETLGADRESGWSRLLRSEGQPYFGDSGPRDVVFVEYELWCYRCPAEADCRTGVVWETGE